MQKRHADLARLHAAVEILANGEPLPFAYGDHLLTGNDRAVIVWAKRKLMAPPDHEHPRKPRFRDMVLR